MQAQHRAMWQPSFVVSLGALMFLAALVAPSRIHVGWRTNDCDCEQSWERGKKGVKAACLFLSLVRAGSHITCLCTLLLATYRCVTLNVGYYGCRSLLLLGGKNNILSSGRQSTCFLAYTLYMVFIHPIIQAFFYAVHVHTLFQCSRAARLLLLRRILMFTTHHFYSFIFSYLYYNFTA